MQNGIDQAGRTHQLLDNLAGVRRFVIGGCRRNKHGLSHHCLEFVKAQRTIVHRRWQPKSIVDQIFLARPVSFVHTTDLRDRYMTFVDHHQRILRQIVDQCRWRLAGFTSAHVPRIIFDAFAKADFIQHFQIEGRTLLYALCFKQLVFVREVFDSFTQLDLDALKRVQYSAARRHIVALRVDSKARQGLDGVAGQWIEQRQRINFVVEH